MFTSSQPHHIQNWCVTTTPSISQAPPVCLCSLSPVSELVAILGETWPHLNYSLSLIPHILPVLSILTPQHHRIPLHFHKPTTSSYIPGTMTPRLALHGIPARRRGASRGSAHGPSGPGLGLPPLALLVLSMVLGVQFKHDLSGLS